MRAEHRWHVCDRWVLTGFVGFGEVAATTGDFGEGILSAAGVSVRRVLSARHQVTLSFDYAVGEDDAEFYFGVGEAF